MATGVYTENEPDVVVVYDGGRGQSVGQTGPNVLNYGADPTGVRDSTAAFTSAWAACAPGERAYAPPGTYKISRLSFVTAGGLQGDGSSSVRLVLTALSLSPAFGVVPAVTGRVHLSGFTLDVSAVPTVTAMVLNNANYLSLLEDVVVVGGAIGAQFLNTGDTDVVRCAFRNQTETAVDVDGDTCGEVYLDNVRISREVSGTLDCGYQLRRTTTADVGGHYLTNVKVTHPAGSVTTGFRIVSTNPSPSAGIVFMDRCVADGCTTTALAATNMENIRVVESWLTTTGTSFAVRLEGGQDYTFLGNWIDGGPSPSGSFDFHDAPIHPNIRNNRCNQGICFFMSGAPGDRPINLEYGGNDIAGGVLTNSVGDLLLCQVSNTAASSLETHVGGVGILAEAAAAVVPQASNVYRITVDQLGTTPGTWRVLGVGPLGTVTVLFDNLVK